VAKDSSSTRSETALAAATPSTTPTGEQNDEGAGHRSLGDALLQRGPGHYPPTAGIPIGIPFA
jgi:hypothetical protein